jgi:hypothetical protein
MAQLWNPARQERVLIPLAVLGLAAFYVLGLDQGHLLSLVQGGVAFDQNLIHEFVHDARHAAGFPCH